MDTQDSKTLPLQRRDVSCSWKRPTGDWIKCSFDGPYVNVDVPSQTEWALRDQDGVYMGAGQGIGKKVPNAIESKFQAIIWLCNIVGVEDTRR